MTWRALIIQIAAATILSAPAFAMEHERTDTPGLHPMLDQALKGEGGVQVYVDKEGNIGTVIDAGSGHRTFSVQPPASQSRNLGPPLQLHHKPLSLPINPATPAPSGKSSASTPAQ